MKDELVRVQELSGLPPAEAARELAVMWRKRAQRCIDSGENDRAGVYERVALDLCFAMGIPLPPRPGGSSSR